jgi:hypothetical protein
VAKKQNQKQYQRWAVIDRATNELLSVRRTRQEAREEAGGFTSLYRIAKVVIFPRGE